MSRIYKNKILDNGLRIVAHPMSKMQSVAIGIWIRVGGRYESAEFKGIAHFLEHLVFKGSKNYSCRKIKESIEGVGGSLNGFTSEELTCYLVKIPYSYLDIALNVLSDMVRNPLLLEKEINKERTVILEEIKMYKDLPQSYVYELLDELLWPDQPLGAPIIGTADSVNKIKRGSLSLFKERYYTAPNIIISVAGALDFDKFTDKVSAIFSAGQDKNINAFSKVREQQFKPKLKLLYKETEQTHMALGFRGFKREHPLKYALGLLHIVLGANMSSRLFNEVREKNGLAYEIGTQVKYFQDTGAFIVHAGIDNRNVSEAIKLILKELKKAKDKLVTAAEFKRAKEFYLGQLMLALEDTLDHMLWIGESLATLDKVYSLEDIIKEVRKVKRENIREAAESILQEGRLNLALIGPLKDKEKEIYRQLN
ncbi:MAG: pitrilysin family protein [Candidatus Omnitrophica bacterium]|nr:pitrilysin family protein [Candidatus Omnitrophota bacterium]MDD5592350.1 pitrilysin family protein [Candidatus Omnitrophota bacterium]